MEVDATDGRIYLPKELREKYGDQFRLVERGEQLVLLPVSEDPLAALREEFADVDKSVEELRQDARSSAIDDAGE
ncbi:AbrB/MazE/SpoVT family DNA-binding domain-containing protein [Salinarchaeum laminariae]|uniref:AbrB/MazE/SpoVT family DNA-binding domain-containing protein n=1 Tax=Salinarchaeum laminariae TaxID=869888 RepID=UPI0020BDAD49|nr:AbrB/MazE/SpoVT family DNA-binding domain-containing protein [Salinarchaeum laminariae]